MPGTFIGCPCRTPIATVKHLRLTITPGKRTIHPMYDLVSGSEYVTSAKLVHWNLRNVGHPALLFVITGNRERFEANLADLSHVRAYDLAPIDDDRFYVHFQPEPTDVIRGLFATLASRSIIVIPPITYRNGSAVVGVVGSPTDLQKTLEDMPEGIRISVDAIGSYRSERDEPAATLSDRQREAVLAGLELGYYDTPRQATHEDVAEAMGCAPSTASEHLQKAEAKLIRAAMSPLLGE